MEDEPSRLARPESTIAQSFAGELDSLFGLGMGGGGIDGLSQNVEEKKQNVTSGQSELEQLEARLRETEQRLAKVSRQNSPSRPANPGAADVWGKDATAGSSAPSASTAGKQPHPFSQKPTYPDDRPPTAPRTADTRPEGGRQNTQDMVSGMPGGMPETPGQQGNGRDDYVMVENGSRR